MGLKLGEGNQPQGELRVGSGVGCKAGSELAVCPAGRFVGPPTTWPPKCCCGRATARSQTCGHWAVSCKCTGWGLWGALWGSPIALCVPAMLKGRGEGL